MQLSNELNSTRIQKLSRSSWRGNRNAKPERKTDKEKRVSGRRCFKLSNKPTRNWNSRRLFHWMQIKSALIYKMTNCNCLQTRACLWVEKEDKLEIKYSNQPKPLTNHLWIMLNWALKQKTRSILHPRRRIWSSWETSSMTAPWWAIHHQVDHSQLLMCPNPMGKMQIRKEVNRIKSLNWNSWGTRRTLTSCCSIRISWRTPTPTKWSISPT